MLKKIAFCVALLTATHLGAQSYEATRFYLGGHVAGSFPWIVNQSNYGLPELRYKPAPGFSGGLVAGMSFTSQHQVQIEVSYALHGQSYQENIYGGVFDMQKDIDISYIQVPLMYRFGMKRAKDAIFYKDVTTFFFTAGVQPGFLIAENIDWKLDEQNVTWEDLYTQFSDPVYDYTNILQAPATSGNWYRHFDFGVAGGFGVQRFIKEKLLISLELRTYLGLLDINNDKPDQAPDRTWRVPNRSNVYGASRNFSAGLRLNASYIF